MGFELRASYRWWKLENLTDVFWSEPSWLFRCELPSFGDVDREDVCLEMWSLKIIHKPGCEQFGELLTFRANVQKKASSIHEQGASWLSRGGWHSHLHRASSVVKCDYIPEVTDISTADTSKTQNYLKLLYVMLSGWHHEPWNSNFPDRCCVVSSWEINLTIWTHRPAMTRTKNKRSSQTLLSRSPLRHRSRPFSTKNKPTLENKHKTLRHASAQRIMKINYACVQLEETQSIIQNQYSLWVSARWGGWREAPALPLWSKAGLRRSAFLASQKLVSAFCATWINRGRPSLAAQ